MNANIFGIIFFFMICKGKETKLNATKLICKLKRTRQTSLTTS